METDVQVRLGHINIRTARFEATVDFYERLLGLRRGPAATLLDQARNAWLFDADGRAIIHVNTVGSGDGALPVGGTLDHVAFDCDDIAGMRARLQDLGLDFTESQTRIPGLSQINLRDPNGLKLELTFGSEAALRDRLPPT